MPLTEATKRAVAGKVERTTLPTEVGMVGSAAWQ